jgi:hypothetical protein
VATLCSAKTHRDQQGAKNFQGRALAGCVWVASGATFCRDLQLTDAQLYDDVQSTLEATLSS